VNVSISRAAGSFSANWEVSDVCHHGAPDKLGIFSRNVISAPWEPFGPSVIQLRGVGFPSESWNGIGVNIP
jgi:hypothetical protein